MNKSKLYLVEAKLIYYAYADSHEDAEALVHDALRDNDPEPSAVLISNVSTHVPTGGWGLGDLVYHDGLGDVSLGQVIRGEVPGEDSDEPTDDE